MNIAMIGQKGIPATWGGVENHVDHLSRRLADAEMDVLVYTRPHYVSAQTVKEMNAQYTHLRLVSLPSIHTKHLDAITHTFLATIHAMIKNVDVYHYHSVGPSLLSFLPRLFRPHARVVTTFHSPDREHKKWGGFARFVLTLGERAAVTFAHKTITVSRDLQQYSQQQYKKETAYIPNGVPQATNLRPSMIEAAYGLKGNDYLLVVTRLVAHKGVHHLIRAFRQITTDKKLVIVGDSTHTDAYVKELKQLAGDDNRIIFTGYQTGQILKELFSNCYLYVHPSESEGLSVSLLEAGSYGKAILTSDIPANAEVVQEHGFLFENKNVDDLVAKLRTYLADERLVVESGKRLRQHVRTHYDWNTIAQETANLYAAISAHTSLQSDDSLQKEGARAN